MPMGSQDIDSINMNTTTQVFLSPKWFYRHTAVSPLSQKLANYDPQTKSSPLPVSVNKVLLEPTVHIHLCIVYVYFCAKIAEL